MWGDKECQASEAYWKAQAKFENLERMKNKGWGEKPPKIEENKMNKDIEALERGLKFFEELKESQPPSVTDLIERLDQRYGNPNAKDCALIQEAIKALRSQQEEIHALLGDVMEMAKGKDNG
jgi:hypothetical protein